MTRCLLCDRPCDLWHWTCNQCRPLLLRIAVQAITEEAKEEAKAEDNGG
jgi:hypothetical protein